MEVLSYGYKCPRTGDRGSVFWAALEFTIERLNDHTHDGSNSAALSASNVVAVTQTLLLANWSAVSNGIYRQLVTVPSSKLFADYNISFRTTGTSATVLHLSCERVSATTFYVYTNDSSIDVAVLYS